MASPGWRTTGGGRRAPPVPAGRIRRSTTTAARISAAAIPTVGLAAIADHGRALVFLAADGVQPDNTGRGYIFRRVLRRAVRHGKLLGLEEPCLARAADSVIELMKGHYVELAERRDQIVQTLSAEEERFSQTLSVGLQLLTKELDDLARRGATEGPGEGAFRLHETPGCPLEW